MKLSPRKKQKEEHFRLAFPEHNTYIAAMLGRLNNVCFKSFAAIVISFVLLTSQVFAQVKKAAPTKAPAPAAKTPAPVARPPSAPRPLPPPVEAEPEEAVSAGPEAGEEKEEDPSDREILFMKLLIKARMPDYAQICLEQLIKKDPEAKARASAIKIDIYAGVGQYAEAEKFIASLPADALETWIMRLALAEKYYEANKMTEARGHYDAFFKKYPQGPPAGMGKFYMEQAYRYAQMLMFKGEEEAATDAFGYVLLGKPEKDVEFKIRIDLAELCVKLAEKKTGKERDDFFKKARDACEPVLWKDQGGPLFGKALMILTHMELIKGDKKAAKKMIHTYMPIVKQLEDVLKLNKISMDFSPMAECRYLLATISEEEGKAAFAAKNAKEGLDLMTTALKHFVNVAAQYQTSQWAVPAGEGQERVAAFLNAQGFKIDIPHFDKSAIMKAQLQEAQSLVDQNRFKEASVRFLIYLNVNPELDASAAALGELARCYAEMKNPIYYNAVVGYLAERFSKNEKLFEHAANAMLRAAATANEADPELGRKTYDLYIKYYPTHKKVPGVLLQFAETKIKENNFDQAADYLQKICSQYSKAPVYFTAMNRLSFCYTKLNDYSNAVQVLTKTIGELQPGPEELEARFRRADAYRKMEKVAPAIAEYTAIITSVGGPNKAVYQKTKDDADKVKSILENVYFWRGYNYMLLNKPVENVKAYQQQAISDFTRFVTDYPASPVAPTALSRLGTLLQANGRVDEAGKIFDKLVNEYKDSNEAKDVAFIQAIGLMEMKQTDKAIEVLEKMLANEKAFDAPKFLRAARILYDNKQYATAIKFFEKAKTMAKTREVWEPALLGIGQAHYANGNSGEAARAIDELFKKYPRTPLLAEAGFVLSKAYAEVGSKETDPVKKNAAFQNADIAMSRSMGAITDPEMKVKGELQLADVQILKGEKDKATATYYRILSRDWNDPKLRSSLDNAIEKGLPLLLEKVMLEEVYILGGKYLVQFPRGAAIRDARKCRDAAKLKMMMSGQALPEEGSGLMQSAPAASSAPAETNAPALASANPAAGAAPSAPATQNVSTPVIPKTAEQSATNAATAAQPATQPAGPAVAPAGGK